MSGTCKLVATTKTYAKNMTLHMFQGVTEIILPLQSEQIYLHVYVDLKKCFEESFDFNTMSTVYGKSTTGASTSVTRGKFNCRAKWLINKSELFANKCSSTLTLSKQIKWLVDLSLLTFCSSYNRFIKSKQSLQVQHIVHCCL